MKNINIGAGQTYIPGFINIDIDEKADITIDLSVDKLPFETSSVDLVFTYHTLEHIPNYLFALSEIHRVLRPGGILLVGVPYVSLTKYNLVNPYHLHNFNEHSFHFFDALKGSAVEKNPILFKKVFHRCHYMRIFNLIPYPLNRVCRNHFFNVVRKIDFGLVAIKDDHDSISIPKKKELKRLFKETANKRVPYVKIESKADRSVFYRYLRDVYNWWNGY
ncbi:MAG: class I SAM-dependent methyltransferase [Flavobacteriaceae bacterium]|nr:class I SAM-dependent methyltransferase [Bacteroidia bacterium]MBT8286624.1 class I SAM-dependent methyltransferase [Bacteroidia bacterium]NNF75149.1 class I SAM-dependent methyltransferase [Flavobacteriaceae bacterium]NNK72165.1 class I SAM-dependent methyltransferase [Flavobacteriaceae bacterium]